ncbi:MAG: efflux RND transporter permease subunit [Desulfomonilaceae bacterium]|nr:efflux RND transporter permease subunit [Desulfomonilaceae bacterium]
MRITDSSVKRRTATSVIVIALVVLGSYGLWRIPLNFLPDITYPLVKVHIYWPGATPEEIDKSLADPVERQLASVEGLDYLESSAIEGMYTALVNFEYGVDVNVGYQDVLAAMARAARNLPEDIEPPIIIKADPSQLPVVQLTASSEQWDLVKLRTWVEDWLQDRLMAVPGVAGTEIVGGLKREIRVHLDAKGVEKYQLTLANVIKRLREENVEQFGGRVTVGPREYIARTVGEYDNLDQIKNVLLARKDEGKVFVGDVANVEDSHEDVRVITRLDGKPCVKLSVLKQADANTVEVARAVNRKIQELQAGFPEGVQIGMVENQAEYIEAALTGVRNAAVEGAILVILIVYVFLGSWRQALVMALALPVTMVVNFGLMKIAGFSLNIFSLGGLVVAISVVLDNSIVVIENITRLKHEQPDAPLDRVAVTATAEVGPAIVAATLSFIAIFVPFLILPGLVSLLFRELILVIAGVVIISLITAVTFAPMLTSALLGRTSPHDSESTRFQRLFSRVTEGYGLVLESILRRRWIAVGTLCAVLVGLVIVLPRMGTEFLPQVDDGRIMVKVRLPTGASVSETDKALRRIEALMEDDPLIESYFTLVGGKVWGLYTYQIANEGEINIQLVPRHDRNLSTNEYVARLRPAAAKIGIPGGKAMVMPMKVKGIRKLGDADIELSIRGPDTTLIFELAQRAAGIMNKLAYFTNVYVSMDMTKPEYQIHVDRKRSAELGVSISDVAGSVKALLHGAVATKYREGQRYYNVRVVIPEQEMTTRQDLENLVLECAQGGYLRVRDLATVNQAVGPVEIVREDQVKSVVVRGDASGTTVGQALAELKDALAKMKRPTGYEFTFGGQALMMADMKRTTTGILAFALFFAFVVLAVQFNSLKLPALILGSVPFCLAGLIYMLYLTGIPLGATVLIGALVVVAATVNEGVLLLTFAEELRVRDRLSAFDAVIAGAKIRLRPRLMTTIPIIMGLIPLALNIEDGGDMLQPMAVGAIGGLIMLLPVALFLMPCLYVICTPEKNSEC